MTEKEMTLKVRQSIKSQSTIGDDALSVKTEVDKAK